MHYKEILKLKWPNKIPIQFIDETYSGIVWNVLDQTPNPTQAELDDAISSINSEQNYISGDQVGMTSESGFQPSLGLILANSDIVPGTYTKLTMDKKGRAVAGSNLDASDIPDLDWNKITTGKPSTISESGILDVYTKTETDTRIEAVVGAAPAALDTLQELAAQLASDESAVAALTSALSSKEPAIAAGTIAQYYRGDKTWQDLATFVRATVLTGLSTATNAAVVATDTALAAFGKLQAQINAALAYVDSAIDTERSAVANLLNKTLISPVIKNYTEYSYSANVSGAVTIDLNNGTLQELTLTANTTFTLPASVVGKSYTLIIGYDGAFIPSFAGGSTLKWSGQAAPSAKSTAGFFDIFVFTCDGTITFGRSGGSNF